jgi:hypothetical protein
MHSQAILRGRRISACPSDRGRSTASAPSLKENFHGNLCSFTSRYVCLFLAQPQCHATDDGPGLHAFGTTCDQGEPRIHSSAYFLDSADQRANTDGVHRKGITKWRAGTIQFLSSDISVSSTVVLYHPLPQIINSRTILPGSTMDYRWSALAIVRQTRSGLRQRHSHRSHV